MAKESALLLKVFNRITMPYKILLIALFLSFIEGIAGLWFPLLTRDLIQQVTAGSMEKSLFVLIAGVILVQALSNGFAYYLLGTAGEKITASLRKTLVNKLPLMPMAFHDQQASGELASRVIDDTSTLENLLTEQAISFIISVFLIAASAFILFRLDGTLAFILFGSIALGLLAIVPIAAKLQNVGQTIQDDKAQFSRKLITMLTQIRLVKTATAEKSASKNALHSVQNLHDVGLREAKILSFLGPIITLVMTFGLAGIVGYGGVRVSTGDLDVGTLVAFILYIFQVMIPAVQLTSFFAAFSKATGSASRLVPLLDDQIEDIHSGEKNITNDGQLTFHNVSFQYEPNKTVLDDIQLSIPAKSTLAVVGLSGSGKSTLLHLLARLYPPTAGHIEYDNQPIDRLSIKRWREQLGYITQDAPIIDGTIRDNINFGMSEPFSDDVLLAALQRAFSGDFLNQLPQGLDTETGEGGLKLSGGQKQRIAITRVLLRQPPIIILDEATANLDVDAIQGLRIALADLMRETITIIVTHRLSTIQDVDQIAFMDRGKIVGVGDHATLMEVCAKFRHLVEMDRVDRLIASA